VWGDRVITDTRQPDSFIADVVLGRNPAASPSRIDSLLDWVVAHQNDSHNAGAKGDDRVFSYLNRTLFSRNSHPYRVLGLRPSSDADAIRARYKRLLQVFHPDRHADDPDWFTGCTEEINRAYAYLKTHHGKPGAARMSSASSVAGNYGKRQATGFRKQGVERPEEPIYAKRSQIRRTLNSVLGSPGKLRKRIYIALFLVPAILLSVVYLSNRTIVSVRAPAAAQDVQRSDDVLSVKSPDEITIWQLDN